MLKLSEAIQTLKNKFEPSFYKTQTGELKDFQQIKYFLKGEIRPSEMKKSQKQSLENLLREFYGEFKPNFGLIVDGKIKPDHEELKLLLKKVEDRIEILR
jgi:hypothetical protein